MQKSKERDVSNEQILYLLINFREEDAKRDSFTDIQVNREKCREVGLFSYKIKDTGEKRMENLFLINETHDGVPVDVIYDKKGRFIAWKNYEKDPNGELQIAKDIELDKERLERQLIRDLERERVVTETNSSSSSSDTTKAGEGRDLGNKEHEEKEQNQNVNKEDTKQQEIKPLKNLKNDINLSGKTRIAMDTIINGYYLWEILNVEEKLAGRIPEGVSERSFRNGYLTVVPSSELEQKDGKHREPEFTFAVCNFSGDMIELDGGVLEPQKIGPIEEQEQYEKNSEYFADGKEVAKPTTDMVLTRKARYKIPGAYSRFNVNENWYLEVDEDEQSRKYGANPSDGKVHEISFVQEPMRTSEIYSQDSAEARTRQSIKCKLEDVSEPPLSEKEQEQMDRLRSKDANEAINSRKEHLQEFENVVENLTKQYGESYRKTIEAQVEAEHKKGKSPEEAEKNVKENMDEMENEYYIHGRSRRG